MHRRGADRSRALLFLHRGAYLPNKTCCVVQSLPDLPAEQVHAARAAVAPVDYVVAPPLSAASVVTIMTELHGCIRHFLLCANQVSILNN
jgi:hypothetical protein